MNNSIKRTIVILGIVILFVTSFILLLVGKSDYSSNIPQEKKYVKKSDFSLFNYSEKIDTAKIKETFPYDDYLKIANINHPASIIKDLADLDSVQPFNMTLNEDILIDALTKKLAERNKNIYNEYNPDTLISLFQWTEKFESYSIINSQRKVFFNIIYDYWMNFIANKLAKLYDSQPALIYDYKFKYLVSRCQEKNIMYQ
ncbi:MAG: hypothetical protein M0D57_08445 [Sphingobacteriales bacterium JAD_PAG50586_3]|nr:MAG: hypothetical protein M0D57_08445 [Sphingobacteriales bacterium JAD_PAG50586_3]